MSALYNSYGQINFSNHILPSGLCEFSILSTISSFPFLDSMPSFPHDIPPSWIDKLPQRGWEAFVQVPGIPIILFSRYQ